MNIQLYQNARTTPAIRMELQAHPSSVSNRELAGIPAGAGNRNHECIRIDTNSVHPRGCGEHMIE